MNWLDAVIIVVLVISILSGLRSGLIKILFGLVGIVVGVVLAGHFADSLASKMTFINNPEWAKMAAFAIILVATMLVFAILAVILSKLISAILLGWVNRLGGAVLGLVAGALFCGAFLSIWLHYNLGGQDVISHSALARFLLDKFPVVLKLLPSEFKSIKDFFSY